MKFRKQGKYVKFKQANADIGYRNIFIRKQRRTVLKIINVKL